ncbi:MAG: hypoxanthine phosphoribosyltransferase [Candidatus Pacebacteria bacterium]|nr:hypoxanthine phosphoribosyltransferase [Candidatus Paceibacterota bacterium]
MNSVVKVPETGLIHDEDTGEASFRADLQPQISRLLISSTVIAERVMGLAGDIIADVRRDSSKALQLVIVLKGATVFANALAQAIFRRNGPPIRFNYIKTSSYGRDLSSSGHVDIMGQLPYVRGRDLLIVEDIVDTGLTLHELRRYLRDERKAASVSICTLLDKPTRRLPELRQTLKLDYVGFNVPDVFVAGYGIDCAEHLRELPFIVSVNEAFFAQKQESC